MKESEAKVKWCPMARMVDIEGNPSANRDMDGTLLGGCLGSECAVWIDETPKGGFDTTIDGQTSYREGSKIPLGHCGLIHK